MTSPGRQCVILVGGLGTRLGSLTADCPKPLLEVGGRPFLAHLIANAKRFGLDRFLLLAGFRADLVQRFASQYADLYGVTIEVAVEEKPAGTGGALREVAHLLDEEFLLLNGDTFYDLNLLALATSASDGEAVGRIALRSVPDASRYGLVHLEGTRILRVDEKTGGANEGLINGGAYWLKRAILDWITTSPMSLERDVFPVLASNSLLHGFRFDGAFIDIGVPADLALARRSWPDLIRRPAVFFDRDGVLNEDEGYTHKVENFRWLPGARDAIRRANDRNCYVFVVTNQAGVARGYYDEQAVLDLHAWMNDDLRRDGAHIDDFRYCPHHPEGTRAEYRQHCRCRKPGTKMIEDLLQDWPVDRRRSYLVGDKQSDIDAASAAGLTAFLFDGATYEPVEELNGTTAA